MSDDKNFEVDLTPDISSLKMFKSLSFTPWFALGEFIDNSITSAIKNRERLIKDNGKDYKLQIRIEFNRKSGHLVVSDNAAGISEFELRQRALRTGIPPEDTSIGLGKHGVGLKAAALWWGDTLEIQTYPIGEPNGWRVKIDISSKDVSDHAVVEAIDPRKFPGTKITIGSLGKKIPQAKTVTAIKAYLRSIYRRYLSDLDNGIKCEIFYEDELLTFDEPRLLFAPFWPDKDGPGTGMVEKLWKRDIEIQLKSGVVISGWFGILDEMSRDLSGFFLHYRGKGIAGVVPLASRDDEDLEEARDAVSKAAYKPRSIFKQPGSYPDQSFVGEFDITTFGKSITTDSPLWTPEEENEFVEKLQTEMSKDDMNFSRMVQNYRRRRAKSKTYGISESEEKREEDIFKLSQDGRISHTSSPSESHDQVAAGVIKELSQKNDRGLGFELNDLEGHTHHFRVCLIEDVSSDFLVVRESDDDKDHLIFINFAHPIFDDLIMTKDTFKIVRRISVALASAEVFALNWDKKIVRTKMNEILFRLGSRADHE